MEGLINDHASFDMEDALEDFKRFIKEFKDFVLLCSRTSNHLSMGRTAIVVLCCLKVRRSIKMKNKKIKIYIRDEKRRKERKKEEGKEKKRRRRRRRKKKKKAKNKKTKKIKE
jgi:hypothetical protein